MKMPNTKSCRLCLIKQEETNYKQIHEETFENMDIYKLIQYCLPQLSPIKTCLDPVICLQCLEKLYLYYEFMSTCYQNDQEFRINNQPPQIDNRSSCSFEQDTLVKSQNCNEKECPSSTVKPKKRAKYQLYRNKFKNNDCPGCKNRILNAKFHSKVQSTNFDCFHCGKRFFFLNDIKKHLYNHMQLVKCEICDKKCRDKYLLKLHLLTHTGEKLYECPVCKKSFVQSYTLHQHMGMHEQHGNNMCHICNKTLSTKYNLKIHLLSMHNKESKPRCPICNKWFYTEIALEKHVSSCKVEDDIDEPDFVKIEETSLYDEEEDDVFTEEMS